MSLRRFLSTNRNADRSSLALDNDRTPTYTSIGNVTTAPTQSLSGISGRDPDETESSLTDTLGVANYIYYRIYAEDGAIPSKTPVSPGDAFLGRIKATSVPPPHTAKAVKRSISKAENIKDRTNTSLFLTLYSESPMGDADKVSTCPGSTPQEPLALVAKMSDSERSALESGGREGHASASAARPDTTPQEIRYVYYLLYADDYEVPSKVAIDPEKPSLGRIRADSVAPPHSPASIKLCVSRVERIPALAHSDLFADISCDTPLKGGHISILRTDGPGLSPNEPMAIVQAESPSIPDGKYIIKNRTADIFWNAGLSSIMFLPTTMAEAKDSIYSQWDITHDANGYISMKSLYAPSSWVGREVTGSIEIQVSTMPIPWRLILADSKFHYLTTDINRVSQYPRVPVAAQSSTYNVPGTMATLKEGDQWQMWEFIRI